MSHTSCRMKLPTTYTSLAEFMVLGTDTRSRISISELMPWDRGGGGGGAVGGTDTRSRISISELMPWDRGGGGCGGGGWGARDTGGVCGMGVGALPLRKGTAWTSLGLAWASHEATRGTALIRRRVPLGLPGQRALGRAVMHRPPKAPGSGVLPGSGAGPRSPLPGDHHPPAPGGRGGGGGAGGTAGVERGFVERRGPPKMDPVGHAAEGRGSLHTSRGCSVVRHSQSAALAQRIQWSTPCPLTTEGQPLTANGQAHDSLRSTSDAGG